MLRVERWDGPDGVRVSTDGAEAYAGRTKHGLLVVVHRLEDGRVVRSRTLAALSEGEAEALRGALDRICQTASVGGES